MPLESEARHLHCMSCGKRVSTGFVPVATDTPDKGLVIRAYIECPECMEKSYQEYVKKFPLNDPRD